MNQIKNTISWVSLYLVGTCFFLAANAFVIVHIVDPNNIKQTLKEEGTYGKVVPAILASSHYTKDKTGTIPFNEPWVQDIAFKAFPAQDIQKQGEVVIDSAFSWLDGKTDKPQFTLDFTANKLQLANETANYVASRLATLPACTLQNLPSTVDPYRIECLPPGVSPAVVARTVASQVNNDQILLEDSVISSDDTTPNGITNMSQTPDNAVTSMLKQAYQHKQFALWVLPIVTITLAAMGILLAGNRRRALRRLSHSFLLAGLSLCIVAVFLTVGTQAITTSFAKDPVINDLLSPLYTALMVQARTIYLIFAAIGLGAGGILVLIRRRLYTS